MRNRCILAAACFGLLLTEVLGSPAKVSPVQPKARPRQAAPDAAAEEKALAKVQEGYSAEFDKAKTPQQKSALAAKLLAAAKRARRGSADQFAFLKSARDLAAQAGSADLALQAADATAEQFEVDAWQIKAELLPKLAPAARQPADKKALAQAGIAAAEQAVARDDYPTAEKMLDLASAAARDLKDQALIQQLAARREAVRELASVYAVVAKTRAVLEQKPKDPSANLAMGSFLCLWKGDWEAGLPMLAASSDATLRSLAERERDASDSAQARAELADAWWDFAMKSDGTARKQLQLHAAHWYRLAIPKLPEGLTRSKAQKRLGDVAGLAASLPMTAKTAASSASSAEPGAKAESGPRGRLARKARYESMLGIYLDALKPIPYVNLNVPNGSNLLTENILTLLRGRMDISNIFYAGVAHFEIPEDGTYEFDHHFGQFLIDRRDVGLAGRKGTMVLRKGIHEVRVREGYARLRVSTLKITNKKTGEPVPVFNYGADIDKFLRQTIGPWKVAEVSDWESKELPGR